jgi:NitT/TauT family transport system permease protein
MRRWLWLVLPPVAIFLLLTAAAELYIRLAEVPQYLLPAPSAVWAAAREGRELLLSALWQTTLATLIGFAASAVSGVAVAMLLSSARIIRNALYPYTIFFQTVPVVAIAPLLVIWLGPGLAAVVVCAFVVSVFPVIANTLTGLLSTDPALRDLFRLYGAGPIARLLKLRLPWAMPDLLTGLRIAAGLAVIGTIVGEFVAGDIDQAGLGIILVAAAKMGDTATVFAAIGMASLLGVVMLLLLNLLGYLLLRNWHASVKE